MSATTSATDASSSIGLSQEKHSDLSMPSSSEKENSDLNMPSSSQKENSDIKKQSEYDRVGTLLNLIGSSSMVLSWALSALIWVYLKSLGDKHPESLSIVIKNQIKEEWTSFAVSLACSQFFNTYLAYRTYKWELERDSGSHTEDENPWKFGLECCRGGGLIFLSAKAWMAVLLAILKNVLAHALASKA